MKNIFILTFFFILAIIFSGCENESFDEAVMDEPITIVVRTAPFNSLKFQTEIAKYPDGSSKREILLEGELTLRQCSRKLSYHEIKFVIKKEENPELYQTLLGNDIQFVVTSELKMILKFKSDIKLEKGFNQIEL